MSILRFLYQTLCAFLQINDRKHIEQNFHSVANSVAGVMPQGWVLGVLGGSKTLAWGFAMGPHRLCILCFNCWQLKQQICYSFTLLVSYLVFNPFKMAVQF